MNERPLFMHVRDLARTGKLDAYLPESENVDGIWTLLFSIANWVALVSAGIAVAFFALEDRPPGTDADFDHPSIYAALLLILFAGLCWVLSHLTVPKSQRRRKKLGRRGALVPAAIAQVNMGWHEPDNDRAWPGSVVVSFDPKASAQPEAMQALAKALFALKRADRSELPDEQVPLAWTLYHEMGPHRAVPVPRSLSQGLTDCWLVPVSVPPRPLRHGGIPVALALPGDTSHEAFVVLPAEIWPEGSA